MKPVAHKLKNAKSVIIREAGPDDAIDILKYLNQVALESDMLSFGPGEFNLNETEEANFLKYCLQSENQIYLLAEIENRIISALIFTATQRPRTKHSGELSLSVTKEYWDSGIGSLMIDTLIQWASETHIITKINLRVRPDNERAIRLYKKKGFKKEGTISREMLLNGVYHDHHWLGLQL